MRRTNYLAFLFAFASMFVGITPAYAGSCVCNGTTSHSAGIDGGEVVIDRIQNLCIKQSDPNAGGYPITSQGDCDRIQHTQYQQTDAVTCVFNNGSDCNDLTTCNGIACYQANISCNSDDDCQIYKYADATGGSGASAAIAMCKSNLCYLDQTSYQRYINSPSFSVLSQDFRIKKPSFEITIPGLTFTDFENSVDARGYIHIPYIAEFLSTVYKLAMALGSIIAVVMIIFQGVAIITSGGGDGKTEAYHRITQIMIGLIILWGSYAILYTINPDLVAFKILKIKFVDPVPAIDTIDEPVANVDTSYQQTSDGLTVPNYKQFDARWGKTRYGTNSVCTTIAAEGCGPTSLAEVLSAYGASKGVAVTPDQTASWMGIEGHGRVCNHGTGMDTTLATQNFAESPWGNDFAGKNVSQDEAIAYLKQGKPIIFLCHECSGINAKNGTSKGYHGHYMVLTGIDGNGNIQVNDPGANENKAITVMTTDQLKANGGFWYVAPKQ